MYKRWVVFAAFFCIGICQAQVSSSALNGTVTDATGSVVPKASVTVTSRSTGFPRAVVASDSGAYVVSDIPPGVYEISAEASGLAKTVVAQLSRLLRAT